MHRVTIRSGRSPFEIAHLLVNVAVGALGLVLSPPGPSASIYAAFGAGSWLFYLAMGGSSTLCLAALLRPRSTLPRLLAALRAERVGLPVVAATSLAYAAATVISLGWGATVAASLIGGIGVACAVRVRQITRDLQALAVLEAGPDGRP